MRTTLVIQETIKPPLKKVWRFIRNLKYVGNRRHCPICNRNSRKFGMAGVVPREDAQCMFCGAVERHRLVWIYFKRETSFQWPSIADAARRA